MSGLDLLNKRLLQLEKQLEKVRGASPMSHGWQTQRLAKAQRSWDILAQEKMKILILIENEKSNIQTTLV
jgi:predicted secreted hydrolase